MNPIIMKMDSKIFDIFQDILPSEYKLILKNHNHYHDDAYSFTINRIDDNVNIAYIYFSIDKNDKDLYIIYIETTVKKYKSKGIGSYLLMLAATFSEIYVSKILLDDMSDNFNTYNNVYTNLGLKYMNEQEPEMEGKISDVCNYWDNFKSKYRTRDFFEM